MHGQQKHDLKIIEVNTWYTWFGTLRFSLSLSLSLSLPTPNEFTCGFLQEWCTLQGLLI
jgi:hypothetical protein